MSAWLYNGQRVEWRSGNRLNGPLRAHAFFRDVPICGQRVYNAGDPLDVPDYDWRASLLIEPVLGRMVDVCSHCRAYVRPLDDLVAVALDVLDE